MTGEPPHARRRKIVRARVGSSHAKFVEKITHQSGFHKGKTDNSYTCATTSSQARRCIRWSPGGQRSLLHEGRSQKEQAVFHGKNGESYSRSPIYLRGQAMKTECGAFLNIPSDLGASRLPTWRDALRSPEGHRLSNHQAVPETAAARFNVSRRGRHAISSAPPTATNGLPSYRAQ